MAYRSADLCINAGRDPSRIWVAEGTLDDVGPILRDIVEAVANPGAVLIADDRVGPMYARQVMESLRGAGFKAAEHSVPSGETSKSLEVLRDLYVALLHTGVDRDDLIVALGGGVVSDLAGFAAATWMRGVRFAICPTTLESDVDASIGGKTAVNIPGGKNLVGAFHQPSAVMIDPACLHTLDARDVRAGMAESIKHALITSEAFLAWHEENVQQILALENAVLSELILRNVRIKAEVVSQDAEERTGARMRLNFGHTIGHAIEDCSGYALRHGECVALGMLAACRLSADLGLLDPILVSRVERLLAEFELPTRLTQPIDTARILATIRADKKSRGGNVRFILLEGIGKPVIRGDIPETDVIDAYESLRP